MRVVIFQKLSRREQFDFTSHHNLIRKLLTEHQIIYCGAIMDKKKPIPKKEGNVSRRPRPVSKSGDAREEMLKLEKAKALEDIHEIFEEVGREYPSFLEETADADEQHFRGDGNLTAQMTNRKSEKKETRGPTTVGHSGNVTVAQSLKILPTKPKLPPIKKGGSFQGVSTAPAPETRKQLKTTTLTKDDKKKPLPPIPGRKPPVPSCYVGSVPSKPKAGGVQLKPKALLKAKKEEPALIELFSRKTAETGFRPSFSQETLPESTTSEDTDYPSSPNSMSDVLAQIVRKAEIEAKSEASGPFIDQTLLRNPGTCGPLSISLGVNANTNSKNKKKDNKPLGDESRIALAQQITLSSAKWPPSSTTNKRGQSNVPIPSHTKPTYTPMTLPLLSRLPTVPEYIEHDDFADEFIQNIAANAGDRYENPVVKEEVVFDYLRKESVDDGGEGTARTVAPKPPPLDSMNSLKLVHKYPVWPHQVPLHKTLSHLPALKSVVLDDSEITWLRDLGSFLPNLITLSVTRCKLTTLDGTFAFPNLENLFAADNKIKSPSPLSCLEHLRFADLSGNKIESFEGFHFLRGCTNLRCMKLTDTGVSSFPNFHTEMRRLIPSIRDLQPRISAIHGQAVLEDEVEDEEDVTPESIPVVTEEWYEYKVKRDMNWTSASDVSGIGLDAKTQPDTLDNNKSPRQLEYTENEDESQELDEDDWDMDMDSMADEFEWRDEAIRLRQVYVPGRAEFTKRGPTVAPHGIDEMDALLDNIQETNDGLETFKAERQKIDAPMMKPMVLLPPNFADSLDDETTDGSRMSDTRGNYSDSTTTPTSTS